MGKDEYEGFKLNVDALRGTVFRGKKYKILKSFGSERKADSFAEGIEDKLKSKRFPVVVEKVRIGWRFGNRFRVLIPKDVKLEA